MRKDQRLSIINKQVSKIRGKAKGITAINYYQKMYTKDSGESSGLIRFDVQRTIGSTSYNIMCDFLFSSEKLQQTKKIELKGF